MNMDKIKRTERVIVMTRVLCGMPNQIIPFGRFCEMFDLAKSSVSEDVAMIQKATRDWNLGDVETVTGAAGGVRFRPRVADGEALAFVKTLCEKLNAPDRMLPGGYLYLSDLLADPEMVRQIGTILAGPYYNRGIDFVLTMETKGIPVATMTAVALNVPLVIARRASKVYEGSAVNISFPDGKGGIETMSLARRAVQSGQRTLIVDDFMRHGGTARGMITLMSEFGVSVVGLAFVLAQEMEAPLSELPEHPLMLFTENIARDALLVRPADWLVQPA
ncbi:MAG: pur operon repressor [Eubacteriales bacterium]|jgi:purine operon repressor|nr:pur operon repressor [Eubacteriales bacterium]MDD3572006.1 pur operon repressor [Eubacteriales bacterium]MDD4133813.1 pur operon repressor [Eubacteriales bacterium]NLO12660.1 pur operon repressor [Clostridiales bacterium]